MRQTTDKKKENSSSSKNTLKANKCAFVSSAAASPSDKQKALA